MHVDNTFLNSTPLAEGGEAVVYNSPNPGRVIKIYKDCVDKQDKLKRITNLIKKKLPSNIIVPLDIVYNPAGSFIGYEMKAIQGEELKRLGNKKFVKANNISKKDILLMLRQIRDTVISLHNQNIYISDFNDNNVLFDKDLNLYFIDTDSWTIDGQPCQVCMESFQDPLMSSNNFSKETDNFAFAILAFKMLTRLHPFGGTTNPDMDLLSRMKNKMSVIDRSTVKVPKTVDSWNFMSPEFLKDLKNVYETNNRELIGKSLDDFVNNLKYCKDHDGYYYGKYNECPVCNADAKVKVAPEKLQSSSGIPYVILFNEKDVKFNIDKYTYISTTERDGAPLIVSRKDFRTKHEGTLWKMYVSDTNNHGKVVFASYKDAVIITGKDIQFHVNKSFSSEVRVENNSLYYIDKSLNFTKCTLEDKGNSYVNLGKVGVNSIFEVVDSNYFIHSVIADTEIIDINGFNYVNTKPRTISEYGIHYDAATKTWLFITEDNAGKFHTRIFDKNKLIYEEDKIRYNCPLNNICYSNGTIFIPIDKAIRGFNYKSNNYKDFPCDIISEDSKLMREGKKFTVINEKEIYQVG